MRELEFERKEQVLSAPVDLELSVNDLRILVNALDAMVYFGNEHGEEYLDTDGKELRARLKSNYEEMVKTLFGRNRFTLISKDETRSLSNF